MPRYKVQSPDGRTVTLEGIAPPTESDLDQIFSSLPETKKQDALKPPSPLMSGVPEPIRTALETVTRREETLPMIGQAVGGRFGLKGAVAGTAIGEAGKQAVETLKGERKPSLGEFATNVGVTGAVEGLTRGGGKLFFRKQLANEAMQKLGKELGQMKRVMAQNPTLKATSDAIRNQMKTAYDALPDPLKKGKIASALEDWIEYMGKKPELSASDLIDMEKSLGDVAEFGVYKKGAFQPAVDIPNPKANAIARQGRTQVSDIVDDLAEKGGQAGFGKKSKEMSKMIQKFPEFDPSKQYGGFGQRLVTSSVAGMATGNPVIGALTYLFQRFAQSPEVRNALFKATKEPVAKVVGTGAKLSLSELARGAAK